MRDRYVVRWSGGEHVQRNIYIGRFFALNIVRAFIAKLRADGETGPIAVEWQEAAMDAGDWHRIRAVTLAPDEEP